jgi:ketosteroid isomerase-like protein
MRFSDPKTVTLLFNEYINSQDLKSLERLMTEDHTFIDASGEVISGKEEMTKSWETFFERYPDYCNVFSRVESRDNLVIMIGHSECSEKVLDGPAIWTAIIRNGLVAEWRVYGDTEKNRRRLGLV